jgi:plasmid stabilization system protein ParE
MAQVRWSPTAGNDLQDIENFIARDSVLHAIAFVDRVVESAKRSSRILASAVSCPSSTAKTFEN